jgi:hypothetical protein
MSDDRDALLARAALAVAAIALVLLFVAVPHALTGDGLGRYEALNTVLTKGARPDMRYSYVGPLFASPPHRGRQFPGALAACMGAPCRPGGGGRGGPPTRDRRRA